MRMLLPLLFFCVPFFAVQPLVIVSHIPPAQFLSNSGLLFGGDVEGRHARVSERRMWTVE
jgi:hypothetical protein